MMSEFEQYLLPLPALPLAIPFFVRPMKVMPSTLLVDLGKAKPGDLTGMAASYHANFSRREILGRHLEFFFLAGETGPEIQSYPGLTGLVQGQAAQVALENLYLNPCVHGDVRDCNIVREPEFYSVYVFTFAKVRIILDVELLLNIQFLLEAIENSANGRARIIRPCVIEVYGEMVPTVRADIAHKYLTHALQSLPDSLRPEETVYQFLPWN